MTSGFPTTVNDGNYWPTNWENTANAILVGPKPKSGTFMFNGSPNIFQNPTAAIGLLPGMPIPANLENET